MKRMANWIHAGLICLLAGLALCLTVAGLNGFDWAGLGTVYHYRSREYTIEEPFDTLRLDTAEDLRLLPAEDGLCRVVVPEAEDAGIRAAVKVEDGVLVIAREDRRPWYRHVGVFLSEGESWVTVYLPEGQHALTVQGGSGNVTAEPGVGLDTLRVTVTSGEVEIKAAVDKELQVHTSSGGVKLWGLRCEGAITLHSTSGDLWGLDLACGTFTAESTSGEQRYDTLRAEQLSLSSTSGDLRFERLTPGEAEIRTTSGEVRGTVTEPMDFRGSSNSGSLRLPEAARGGGEFRVSTTSGDVHISLTGE